MACTGDGIGAVGAEIALGENRIAFPGSEGTEGARAAVDYLAVIDGCSAFGGHEVIFAIDLIDVRAFAPDGFFFGAAAFVYYDFAFTHAFVAVDVEFDHADRAVTRVFRFCVGRVVVIDDICFAVIVEKECGIDALHLGKIDGIAPFSEGVGGLDEEVSGSAPASLSGQAPSASYP